jgi:hypothetical protein
MKTVTIPPQAIDINVLLEQARREDILVRAADGAKSTVRRSRRYTCPRPLSH